MQGILGIGAFLILDCDLQIRATQMYGKCIREKRAKGRELMKQAIGVLKIFKQIVGSDKQSYPQVLSSIIS